MGVGSFILPQIGGTKEWQRPSDWLPMPTNITATDQITIISSNTTKRAKLSMGMFILKILHKRDMSIIVSQSEEKSIFMSLTLRINTIRHNRISTL